MMSLRRDLFLLMMAYSDRKDHLTADELANFLRNEQKVRGDPDLRLGPARCFKRQWLNPTLSFSLPPPFSLTSSSPHLSCLPAKPIYHS